MNHGFNPSRIDKGKCLTCQRAFIDHTRMASCEVCSNTGECNLYMTILMCKSCEQKEKDLQASNALTADLRVDEYKQQVKNSMSYFNAQITPIVELKEIYELNGKKFEEFHARIKEQILHFSKVLFEHQIEQQPDTNSNLLIEFRAEVRTKIKEQDINYVPPVKAPKVAKPKSALDKAATLLVASAAASGKTITLYEAKQKLMKELGLLS